MLVLLEAGTSRPGIPEAIDAVPPAAIPFCDVTLFAEIGEAEIDSETLCDAL